MYVVVAFMCGELAALVGVNGRAAIIVYLCSVILTVGLYYGLVFVGKPVKTYIEIVSIFCFIAMAVGYMGYRQQEKLYERYDTLQYAEHSQGIQVTGEVAKIQQNQYGYTVELKTGDGIVMLQMDDIGENDGIKHGMSIVATGTIVPMKTADNPGNYDEREYLHGNGVILKIKTDYEDCVMQGDRDDYSFIGEGLYQIKQRALNILSGICTEKEMGLLSAIVLGDKSYMDEEIKELYSSQGIAHVLAISGLHISVIGMGIYGLMRKKMRYLSSATISGIIMILFSFMTGNSISAVRAVIMFVMHVTADVLGRKYDMLSAISLSALVLLMDNPLYITNASFILSFMAMLAVAVVAPVVTEFFKAENTVLKTLLFNISLTFTSMPINSCLFYRLPTYSILLNLLVVPVMGIMLAMAIIGMFVATFSQGIGTIFMGSAVYILRFYEKLCDLTEGLPASSVVTGNIETMDVVGYYVILAFVICIMWRKANRQAVIMKSHNNKMDDKLKHMVNQLKGYRYFYYVALILAVGLMTYMVYKPKLDNFELCFLDVGQGDGAYIHSAVGNDYLIDCGSTDEKEVGKYKLESFLQYKAVDDIEYVFVSHCDTDHISGIVELIEGGNILIENIVLPETERIAPSENGIELVKLANSHDIEVKYFGKGSSFKDGELELICISPDAEFSYKDINEASMALMMRYEELQVFFAGDIGVETEKKLLNDISLFMEETDKKADGNITTIYKVAHHGSKYSSSVELLEVLQPDIAIISCGQDNSYGHPHEETLERLEDVGGGVMITRDVGAIMVNRKKEIKVYGYKR